VFLDESRVTDGDGVGIVVRLILLLLLVILDESWLVTDGDEVGSSKGRLIPLPLDTPLDEPLDTPLDEPLDTLLDEPLDTPLDEPLDFTESLIFIIKISDAKYLQSQKN
jgi:hypothetical protein